MKPSIKKVKGFCVEYSPEILSGISTVTTIGAVIANGIETKKADVAIEKMLIEKNVEKLPFITKVGVNIKSRPWTIGLTTVSVGTNVASTVLSRKKINTWKNAAALLTAENLRKAKLISDLCDPEAVKEWKEKNLTEKTESKIKEWADPEFSITIPTAKNCSSENNQLCYDATFGRYFYADPIMVRRVIQERWEDLLEPNEYVTVNNVYEHMGLPLIDAGNIFKWWYYNGRVISISPVSHQLPDGRNIFAYVFDEFPETTRNPYITHSIY